MRRWILAVLVMGLGTSPASAQTPEAAARQGIRAMFDSLHAAGMRRDRAALERVYAEEFLFVHATGGVVTRKEQIDGIVNRAAPGGGPPVPILDSVRVYGDVAMVRYAEGLRFGTTVWVKRDGRWQVALIQGTMLPERKAAVAIDASKLTDYVGRYERDTLFVLVSVQGDSLMVQRATGPRLPVKPIGPDAFEDRFGASMLFVRNATGAVIFFNYRPAAGQERTWIRRR